MDKEDQTFSFDGYKLTSTVAAGQYAVPEIELFDSVITTDGSKESVIIK